MPLSGNAGPQHLDPGIWGCRRIPASRAQEPGESRCFSIHTMEACPAGTFWLSSPGALGELGPLDFRSKFHSSHKMAPQHTQEPSCPALRPHHQQVQGCAEPTLPLMQRHPRYVCPATCVRPTSARWARWSTCRFPSRCVWESGYQLGWKSGPFGAVRRAQEMAGSLWGVCLGPLPEAPPPARSPTCGQDSSPQGWLDIHG